MYCQEYQIIHIYYSLIINQQKIFFFTSTKSNVSNKTLKKIIVASLRIGNLYFKLSLVIIQWQYCPAETLIYLTHWPDIFDKQSNQILLDISYKNPFPLNQPGEGQSLPTSQHPIELDCTLI